ncbi:MAG: hypothetical protein U0325_26210 [Polyangiales bacterium]
MPEMLHLSPAVMRRRIWCEMLPPRALCRALKPLGDRGIELLAAVRGDEVDDVPALLRACDGEGVRCGLWPMIDDAHGRWPSVSNVRRFERYAERLLEVVPAGVRPPDVAFDLEPPIHEVARWWSHTKVAAAADGDRERWAEAVARFGALASRVRATGAEAVAAVVPMCLYDAAGGGGWQRVMGTPVDDVPWDRATAMLYTSIFEGWSRRTLSRDHARALLVDGCRRVRSRFGDRGGVSLGAVGTGALGDEPTYRDPAELADDVALCVAEGVRDITLFDYAGVLRRPPAEAWLDALVATPEAPRAPRRGARVRALITFAEAVGSAPFSLRRDRR